MRDQVIQESLAEITYLQTLKTPEAVWEIDAKLMDLKLKISEYASEAKMTFDWVFLFETTDNSCSTKNKPSTHTHLCIVKFIIYVL